MHQILLPPRYHDGPLHIRPPQDQGLIATILSDPALYGDGPPQWLQGKSKKPCKSAEEADVDRKRLTKVLRKHGRSSPEALAVAHLLDSCRPDARCHSGACPCCMRAFQRWLVVAGNELLKQSAAQGQPTKILSIIPTKAPSSDGRCHDR